MQISNIRAVIIGIGKYRFSSGPHSLPDVDFAHADAEAFRKLLIEQFSVPEANITFWLDSQATATTLNNELPYILQGLSDTDEFIFYYAGHGFRSGDVNLLTAWDTHSNNLEGTSASLKKVLLDPLSASTCNRSLLFIDACAKNIPTAGRDIISNLDPAEFKQFITPDGVHAQYMACSMGEKSYSSPTLQHGIWTWHLLEALKGNVPDAFARDRIVTDVSLRDYLRHAVPKYITQKTSIRGTQIPWANLKGGTFQIISFDTSESQSPNSLASIKIEFEDAFFRRIQKFPIRDLGGFKRGHKVPQWCSPATRSFVSSISAPDVEAEATEVYNNLKSLGFKRGDITKNIGDDGANIETDLFRFVLEYQQSTSDASDVVVKRTLALRCPPSDLPEGFEDVFPTGMKEVVIPFEGEADFDSLVSTFEELEEKHGGKLYEDDATTTITYVLPKGAKITVHCDEQEIVVFPQTTSSIQEMIDGSKQALTQLSNPQQISIEE